MKDRDTNILNRRIKRLFFKIFFILKYIKIVILKIKTGENKTTFFRYTASWMSIKQLKINTILKIIQRTLKVDTNSLLSIEIFQSINLLITTFFRYTASCYDLTYSTCQNKYQLVHLCFKKKKKTRRDERIVENYVPIYCKLALKVQYKSLKIIKGPRP